MAKQVQRRWGTTTDMSTRTGAAREIVVDTTLNTAVVCDGVTVGGHPLAKSSELTAGLATKANTSHTHSAVDVSDLTETTQDLVAAMFSGSHVNATISYDDGLGRLTVAATGGAGISEQDTYPVDDYGADPTGATNSTTAIRTAMAAAAANVTATGRRSAVKFSAGKYLMNTRTVSHHIDINGMSSLAFIGAAGRRTVIQFQGDATAADWYAFHVRGASTNIHFQSIAFVMGTITNPDPAEQNHLLQVSGGASNVTVYDCSFTDAVGDGVRVLGDFGSEVKSVAAIDCSFVNCGRSGFGFQRWASQVMVANCRGTGGTDQIIDFEPTGYTLTADAGGSATSLIDASASFVTWGIAPGDLIYHVEDEAAYEITAVTATTLTIAGAGTTWASATYYFPKHSSGHVIVNNHMSRTDAEAAAAGSIMLSVSGTYGSVISGNVVENGTIKTSDCFNCTIVGNTVTAPLTAAADAALEVIKAQDGTRYANNAIHSRSTDVVTGRDGIKCVLATRGPGNASFVNNAVLMSCLGNGIRIESAKGCQVQDNTIWSTRAAGTPESSAIDIRTAGVHCESAMVTGNRIYTVPGGRAWLYGIRLQATNSTDFESSNVSNNSMTNATNGIYFATATGGEYSSPPITIGNLYKTVTYPTAPHAQCPWLQVGGSGGVDIGAYGMFYGMGSPEGVVYAAKGSTANVSDGTVGGVSLLYVKTTSDTVNTGWVSLNRGLPGGTEWGRIKRASWSPAGASTAATVYGLNAFQFTGTNTQRTSSFASITARQTRQAAVSAAGAGSLCGIRHTVGFVTMGSGTYGGFRFVGGHMNSDPATVANARGFYGLWSNTSAPTNIDPATMTNCIGLAQLTTSANLHIVYGGSAAQTPIDLGANFPAGTLSADYYMLELYASPTVNNVVEYVVTRINTGDVATGQLTGTAGAALPADTTGLTINAWRTNNTDALAVAVDYGQMVFEMHE